MRTLLAKARRGHFLGARVGLRNRFWDSIVTVMFFEVVRAVLFWCGGTPIHPFVNPPACCGSRSGRLGPDTEYSIATVSRTQAVSIRIALGNRAESTGTLRLALRHARASPSPGRRADATVPHVAPIPLVVRVCSLLPVSVGKACWRPPHVSTIALSTAPQHPPAGTSPRPPRRRSFGSSRPRVGSGSRQNHT